MSNNENMYNQEWIKQYSLAEFEKKYTYGGDDLGAVYSKTATTFKIWTPFAREVKLNLYKGGNADVDDMIECLSMQGTDNGIWEITVNRDIENVYYTYSVYFAEVYQGVYDCEVCDPYAKACGVNGRRAMVVNLKGTNPDNWDKDRNPNEALPICESVIYELHVRDLSSDASSDIKNKGKFLGLTEQNTTVNGKGKIPTGITHIKDMGITHIHLLPFYDYATIDEAAEYSEEKYNWGYDPLNYNVPEGSYSTNAFDGNVRIKELKQTVKSLHDNGISVVMDVVYNHTYNDDFCFNKSVPGYFQRTDLTGKKSNGSACGNDTASERSMVRKYIVDSVLYWASEYHIDGFRFDLVGLIDTDTINEIRAGLDEIRPNIMMYGEGWTLTTTLTKENIKLCTQNNVNLLNRFAMFSDDIRDAIKGSVFIEEEKGFISGNTENNDILKKSIKGLPIWSDSPKKVINYTSCHDNYTLFDKIRMCNAGITFDDAIRQNLLAISIVMLSQGVPLIHAGEELLRTKTNSKGEFVSDSVRDSDDVNSIKWYTLEKEEYFRAKEYYKGLIEFRKNHQLFMLDNKEDIEKSLSFIDTGNDNVISYRLSNEYEEIIVIFNSLKSEYEVCLENGKAYTIYIDDTAAGNVGIGKCSECVKVNPVSCMVLVSNAVNE